MQTEYSAGTVTFRTSGTNRSVLLIRDAKYVWTFPKGIIENGEDPESTAVRETREETGIRNLHVLSALPPQTYIFTRAGKPVKKTVRYYVCMHTGTSVPKPQEEEGIQKAKFVPVEKAQEILGYPKTNRPVLGRSMQFLNKKTDHPEKQKPQSKQNLRKSPKKNTA